MFHLKYGLLLSISATVWISKRSIENYLKCLFQHIFKNAFPWSLGLQQQKRAKTMQFIDNTIRIGHFTLYHSCNEVSFIRLVTPLISTVHKLMGLRYLPVQWGWAVDPRSPGGYSSWWSLQEPCLPYPG